MELCLSYDKSCKNCSHSRQLTCLRKSKPENLAFSCPVAHYSPTFAARPQDLDKDVQAARLLSLNPKIIIVWLTK